MDFDYHFVKDHVATRILTVSFVSSKCHIVDILTKPLSLARFSLLHSCLTILSVPLESQGNIRSCVSASKDNISQEPSSGKSQQIE